MREIIEENIHTFFDIAYERHTIYRRKELMHIVKPWTEDPIFKKFRFCNVFRKLDKVTDYMIDAVIEPYHSSPHLWQAIIISRFFSRIETLQILINSGLMIPQDKHKESVKMLKELQTTQPIMTSAFILNPLQINGNYYPKLYTPFIIIKDLIKEVGSSYKVDDIFRSYKSIYEVFKVFKSCISTAGFMAYEYATDFTYSKRYFNKKPTDFYTFGNFTVGSLRGMKRLLGYNVDDNVKIDVDLLAVEILKRWNQDVEDTGIAKDHGFEHFGDLSMREVEHWLCEYDKYMRIKNGEAKRLKRNYDG